MFGATSQRFLALLRQPTATEQPEPRWRMIDLPDDYPGETRRKIWPAESTALYWWRPTFWLREPVGIIRYS
jgi:hypothetical protein